MIVLVDRAREIYRRIGKDGAVGAHSVSSITKERTIERLASGITGAALISER
jgi:hypothetical protein